MKTYMAKTNEIEQKWWVVDATDAILGRLAAEIAPLLMGKNKPEYTPNADVGDYVIIVNAEKIRLTGNKAQTKMYDHYTRYPGGRKVIEFGRMIERKPEYVVTQAVKRMLPKNKMGKKQIMKLKVYSGPEHQNQAQQPEKLELSQTQSQ